MSARWVELKQIWNSQRVIPFLVNKSCSFLEVENVILLDNFKDRISHSYEADIAF